MFVDFHVVDYFFGFTEIDSFLILMSKRVVLMCQIYYDTAM